VSAVLYLVRHAEAEEARGMADAGRRLTPAGRAAFQQLVSRVRGELRVLRVRTSPLARARETAAILAAAAGVEVDVEDRLASGRSSGAELLGLGRECGAGTALVGHNPEIAEAVVLATGGAHRVAPGSIAAVAADDVGYRLLWLHAP
jgi:phosphohistidine phosphatase